jgi:catecholate siderophore receptor
MPTTLLTPLILSLVLATPAQDSARRPAATPQPSRRDSLQALEAVKVRAPKARPTRYTAPATSSATRTLTPLREVPQSVTVLGAPVLRDLNIQSMAKAVEYVPGISMGQGEGHRDAPTIRGQSSTADFFVDGVRDDAQYYRDTYNVQQVDALKGANATVFGRGGGGGVINRVMKRAEWTPVRAGRVETGSWEQRRVSLDVGDAIGNVAGRLNVMYEAGNTFRQFADVEKWGVNPTAALMLGRTMVRAGVERYVDRRTVDRGLPSANGRPSAMDTRVHVGDPSVSRANMVVNGAHVQAEFANGHGFTLRTHTRAFDYDKFYQNVFANSAINSAGTQFTLAAYNDAVDRRSLFNQTDAIWKADRGSLRSTFLVGTELSRQQSDNVRLTGYFDNSATSRVVPVSAPTVVTPVTFRSSATDANNHAVATVAAAFMQEQLHLGNHVQLVAGVRHDRFGMQVRNNRTNTTLTRVDHLLSPRGGLVVTPSRTLSFYGSYSVSHLPSSGDQFTALTSTTQTLQPEQFRNREVGLKWAARTGLDLTAAWFTLDRSNTMAPDPVDVTRLVQTGRQRTTGAEFGVQGTVHSRWDVIGGLAVQQARIVNRTSAARVGASTPLVPHTSASLWNKVRVGGGTSLGLGVVHMGQRYAAIDNSVLLPAFTRLDGALYLSLSSRLTMQLNIENLADARFYTTSHGNNNIMPGAPRTLRLVMGVAP